MGRGGGPAERGDGGGDGGGDRDGDGDGDGDGNAAGAAEPNMKRLIMSALGDAALTGKSKPRKVAKLQARCVEAYCAARGGADDALRARAAGKFDAKLAKLAAAGHVALTDDGALVGLPS